MTKVVSSRDSAGYGPHPLELRDIRVAFSTRDQGRLTVLDRVSLIASLGALVCVEGRSGSGKTSLLRVAHGGLTPQHGEVLWSGKDIARMSAEEIAILRREAVGYVPQDAGLIETMTAIENVLIPRMPTGVRSPDVDRARQLLRDLGVGDREGHRPTVLSGGERQRVALARALMNDPPVIIADEPTSGLDRRTADRVIELLAGLREAMLSWSPATIPI